MAKVDVWTIALEEPREIVLSAAELIRAQRFHFEADRLHWTRAHSALREILARYLNAWPAAIEFSVGEHGKPSIAELHFNLSHAGEWAMVAVSRDREVGVDIERFRPDVDMAAPLGRLGERDLPGEPLALLQRWTRREAASKAVGGSLFIAPPNDMEVVDLIAPAGYAAAVAARGTAPEVTYCGIR